MWSRGNRRTTLLDLVTNLGFSLPLSPFLVVAFAVAACEEVIGVFLV
jgi:hypothetical protein